MSVKRAFSNKSNTIYSENGSTANSGFSPILEVFSISGGKLGKVTSRKEYARILMDFNLSSLTASIISKDLPDLRTDTTVSAYLKVFNVKHGDEQMTSFTLNVFPMNRAWNAGTGIDIDKLTNSGYSNALSAQSNVAWSISGAHDFITDSNSASQTFDSGEEDLIVSISSMFSNWLSGASATNGLMIKLTEAQEASSGSTSAVNYFIKKFYSWTTNTNKKPCIELRWLGAITDDRDAIAFNNTGSVFFYNIVNGQLQDLASNSAFPGNITISGLSSANSSFSAIKTVLTAARFSKGIYKCNIGTLPLSANVYSSFRDNWYISASPTANYLFSFTAINPASGFSNYQTGTYKLTLKNLKSEYQKNDKARIRMHIRNTNMQLTSMTGTTTALNNFICTDGYFEIRESKTDNVEIVKDALSYDMNGNFFELFTENLYTNVEYKIIIYLNIAGEQYSYDNHENWNFIIT